MSLDDISPQLRQQAQDRFETLARSLFQIRGLAAPGAEQLGQIVHGAVAGASPDELRAGGSVSAATLGRIDQLILSAVEAGRPRNIHAAEIARLERLGAPGAAALLGAHGKADLVLARREAARAAREAGEGGGGSSSSDRYAALPAAGDKVSPAVMGAYVAQYAGCGLGRGTVQNFAEIGLQRGAYDAYRKEGFSREDIGDAARTAKALDWKHDRQAFDELQRSSRPERAAIVAIDREKDAEKRDALIERKYKELDIEHKPQNVQDRWGRHIDRVQHQGRQIAHEQGIGARSKSGDTALKAEPEHDKSTAAKVRVAKLEVSQARNSAAVVATLGDAFKMPSKPAPPIKVAEAKSASIAPNVG